MTIRLSNRPVRDGSFHRATCLGLAGLLAAAAFAGCGGSSSSPVAEPTTNTQSAEPTTNTPPGESAAEPTATLAQGPTGFSATGSMATARDGSTATLLSDGRVLIAGGSGGAGALATAELYDPTSGTFSPTGSMTEARAYHTATLLSDGRVLIAGGQDSSGKGLASAELYDTTSGTFSPTGSMGAARQLHTATLLSDGRVLIVGGAEVAFGGPALESAELYDPAGGTFSPTGSMAHPREAHTATLLPDGRVLVAGGTTITFGTSTYDAFAELYDPTTGKFSPTGSMAKARYWDTATLLPGGRVLIVGGVEQTLQLASAELYDPASGKFSMTGSMATDRSEHTATLLRDGNVLIAGGTDGTSNASGGYTALASAELYDPTSGKFSRTGSMTVARLEDTATLLPDGRVLIAGGDDANGEVLASADLYQP
jgi:hypothetical protein